MTLRIELAVLKTFFVVVLNFYCCLSVEKKGKSSFSFYVPDFQCAFPPPPEDPSTVGFLPAVCLSFATEDSILGSITDVKSKVLSCVIVSRCAGGGRERAQVHVSRNTFSICFFIFFYLSWQKKETVKHTLVHVALRGPFYL